MKKFILPALLLFSLFACDPKMVYDHFEKTPGDTWNWNEPLFFTPVIADSTRQYNLYLSVRHTREYPKSNLYLFVDITGPNGSSLRDTVELLIAEPSGKWTGNGFGSTLLVRKLYRRNIHFPLTGTYTFRIEQAMRIEELPVTDVGIRIENFYDLR
jgi:gliding motility-associated lipoprotein GldH